MAQDRWTRHNHRGEPVSLLAGPAVTAGTAAAAAAADDPAAFVCALGAGAVGVYDDLAGAGQSAKGFRGDLGALAKGHVTAGAIKILGIGATGLAAAALDGRRGLDLVVTGGCIAGTGETVGNLLDLRPGRASRGCPGGRAADCGPAGDGGCDRSRSRPAPADLSEARHAWRRRRRQRTQQVDEPASITAPPCGAIASPQMVMMSDGARGGAPRARAGSSGGPRHRAREVAR